MGDLLPEEIAWRKKSPYPKTHHPAYLKAVSDALRAVINDPSSPVLQIAKRRRSRGFSRAAMQPRGMGSS